MLDSIDPAEPHMNNAPSAGPSWWFYVLGVAVMLAGVGLFVYDLVHGIVHITDHLTQIVVPGEKDLGMTANSEYTIFLEEQSVVDGRIYSTSRENLEGLTCNVHSLTTGNKIDLRRPAGSTTYNVGGRSGRSVLQFQTQEAGTYHLACFRSLAAMFGYGLIGTLIIIVVFVRRENAKRRSAASLQPIA
jgi:hypothetical protein